MNAQLVDKPNIQIYGTISHPRIFKWTRIILFQFIASMLFTYGLMSSYFTTTQNGALIPNPGHSIFISLVLFLCLIFAGQLTGGHTNPIVTLCLLMSKNNKITILNAVIYISSEFAGSFAGGALAYTSIDNFAVPQPTFETSTVQELGAELVGSFLLCLWLLIIVNQQTTFIKANFWNYILLPVIFFITREYNIYRYKRVTSQVNGLNPASVLANQVFFGLKYNDWTPLDDYWAYIVGPCLGALFSGIFFNYFYLPLLIRWKKKK